MVIERLYQLKQHLPELYDLENLIHSSHSLIRNKILTEIETSGVKLPIHLIELGSTSPNAPLIGFIGGVHGIERIGTQVLLAYLHSLVARMRWDESIHQQLSNIRLFFIPIANPGGMLHNSRCNPNGVDLMRNAPIEAADKVPWLLGGHRISKSLPWYRGKKGSPMEPELQAIYDYCAKTLTDAPFALTLDVHSGFGFNDRLWFPYASSFTPIPDLSLVYRLNRTFTKTFPYHDLYKVEPQAHSYTTHGDVWDLIYDEFREKNPNGQYLPLTLEMGSWLWVKKNPRQLFRYRGLFHPELPHRRSRILRRHYPLLDFLISATRTHSKWRTRKEEKINRDNRAAIRYWYENMSHS